MDIKRDIGRLLLLAALAARPALVRAQTLSTGPLNPSINQLTANWNSTYLAGTVYTAQLSSEAFPNADAGNQSFNTTALSQTFAGLSASTTYYAQVATAPAGPFLDLGAAQTLPPVPGTPGTAAGTVLGVSSISWTWGSSSFAASYKLYEATGAVTLIATTTALSYSETGLVPNSPHVLTLTGYNASGAGPFSANSATYYTLANPPVGTSTAAVYATSTTISWQLNSNAAGTTADVQFSTDGVSFSSIFTTTGTQVVSTGLLGCTSYYYRVRDRNAAGTYTAFGSTLTVQTASTIPSPATGLSAQTLAGGKVGLSWLPSSTEGVTQYGVYYDAGTGTVNYGAPLAVLSSAQTSFTTGVLASSAAYTFAVRTTHRCGPTETTGVFAQAGAASALSPVRAAIVAPEAGKHVTGNSVTLAAGLAAGTPDQAAQVTFQYRVSGTTTWLTVPAAELNHPNPATVYPFYVHTDVTGIAPGNYDVRALAVDLSGSTDTTPGAVTVVVDPVSPDITENVVGGKVQAQQLLNNAVENDIGSAGSGADDPVVRVVLPAGALSASTVTVTVVSNPTITTGPPAGLNFVGPAMQIDLGNGQHALSNGQLAQLTLTYPDNSPFPDTFRIYALDPATGKWSLDFASTVNLTSRTVSGFTPHFSLFAIIGGNPASPDLGLVRVYPNPYKPNGGRADEGKPFSASDPASGIIFDKLPAIVTITIYTAAGRLVARVNDTSGSGAVHWDAKNQDGRDAASGGYFAVITSPGIRSVVRRFAILR